MATNKRYSTELGGPEADPEAELVRIQGLLKASEARAAAAERATEREKMKIQKLQRARSSSISSMSTHPLSLPVEHRAMSLQQLREMRDLVQRLTKAKLLVDEKTGKTLSWPEVNMHHICHLVIKKIIPASAKCSWVEHVASEKQPPQFFVTHNWNEPFRDFMSAIEIHAREVGVRPRETYWICVFAINQFQIELGSDVESSPFVKALKASRAAVLMLDKEAQTLNRIWCLLEMFVVLTKSTAFNLFGGQKLEYHILTPFGMIGARSMNSSPLVAAIRAADCRKSQASMPADRANILSYIAGQPHDSALEKSPQNASLCEAKVERLKSEFDDRFVEFNQKIRDNAEQVGLKGTSRTELFVGPPAVAADERLEIHLRGVTVAQLRTLAQTLQADERLSSNKAWEEANVYDYEKIFMTTGTSFKETYYPSSAGPPDWFISVPFQTKLKTLFRCIEWHAEARGLPDTTVYWSWISSLTQADITAWFNEKSTSPTEAVMPYVQGMLWIADDPQCLVRCNPLHELFKFLLGSVAEKYTKMVVDVACHTGAIATSLPFSGKSYEFGTFDLEMAQGMIDFDIRNAQAKNEDARRKVLIDIAGISEGISKVSGEGPDEVPTDCDNFRAFNNRVRTFGCGPVLRHLAEIGDLNQLRSIIEMLNPSLIDNQVCGVEGQTPLMIAASHGHVEIVKALLTARADPNADDQLGDTALHYAALGGKVETARVLINAGARVDRVNTSIETPLMTAIENPAGFIGIDTSEVEHLFQAVLAVRNNGLHLKIEVY